MNIKHFLALFSVVASSAAGFPAQAATHPEHVADAEAANAKACLEPASWSVPAGESSHRTGVDDILAAMAQQDVVLLGESHTDDDHHRWQAQTLAALYGRRPALVVGFEMFPRRVQPVLDRWVKGELTVKQFVEQSEWDKFWKMPVELYLPLFQFARINRIPMVALNVDQKLNHAIVEKGWKAIPEADREGVGQPAAPSDAYRDYLLEVYRMHPSMAGQDGAKVKKTDRAFLNFVDSQITWDRAMAEALAHQLSPMSPNRKPLVVGIMGSGHVRQGYGVPHQLRDLGVAKVGSLLPVSVETDCRELASGLADAVFALPKTPMVHPDPPRLGVQLEEKDGVVSIVEVMTDSLAEKSGLKTGDHLVEVAGKAVSKVMPVVASVRQQPAGTWLPMRIKRGGEMLELVVKFPIAP